MAWTWPVSPVYVTSPFDPRRVHPVTHVVTPHMGTDFRAPEGAPLYAVHDGTVIASYYDATGGGNYTRIDVGGGVWVGYHHQSVRLVGKGAHVTAGQVIGKSGSTGHSTAAHLHFEVAVNGTRVDPVPFLAERTGASLVANVGLILAPVVTAPDGSLPDPLTPEDDMPTPKEFWDYVLAESGGVGPGSAGDFIRDIAARTANTQAIVKKGIDYDALAAAIVAKLPTGSNVSATEIATTTADLLAARLKG